jgi:S-adenosyl-L-methionine hydrolase (adenosine-forming)
LKTITILTDFGLKDPYVGIMKGVILSINPDVTIVDITHEVEPQDIREGAYLVKDYYPYFKDAIHIAVVDPTVGSRRRAICLSRDGQLFIGPDNGIFSFLIDAYTEIYTIENKDVIAQRVSDTFHGRDIFSPAAAHLSLGARPDALGNRIIDPISLTNIFPDIINEALIGEVVRIDRFGNAITNIEFDIFKEFTGRRSFKITVCNMTFTSISKSYYEKDFTCLVGSSGYLEFGYYKGSFANKLGVKKGEEVRVST